MAGIGWKLQKMIDRNSLAGTMGAYLTGVAVTSAPWLLTTAVLMSLRIAARADGSTSFLKVEQIVTLIYALTVILSAPIHVVVSRYTADRLYDRRLDRIGPPLWRALTFTLCAFLAVGVGLSFVLRVPLPLGVAGTVLTVIVGGQWLLLSVGGGLSSPLVVLRAFCAGAPLGIVASLWLYRGLDLGAVGYLSGFAVGQLVTLLVLLHGIARAIPSEGDEKARLLPAFSEYWLLALSSFVYYVSIWTDKALVWILAGREAASQYSAVSAIAWFSVVPTFGWIYVQIETAFYRRFRAFYGGLGGGAPLAQLRERAEQITAEAVRILRGAALVQGTVLVLALFAAPFLMRLAGLPESLVWPFRMSAVGAALQLMSLLVILLLYYFDLRREALAVSLTLLGAELALITGAHLAGLHASAGYALACAVAATTGLLLVRSRLATLVADTFQTQPYGNAV
jgi:polysaccharide biosynthesis protein PelG